MADTKVSALTADTAPTSDDEGYVVNAPGGTPASRRVTLANWVKGLVFSNATSKAAPLPEDLAAFADSAASNVAKSATFAQLNPAVNAQLTPNAETGSFTFALTDRGKETTISNAGATTATIPPNSSVAFPVNTIIALRQIGAGACTWTEGAGVTINFRSDQSGVTNGQNSGLSYAEKTATDTWTVSGDLVTDNPVKEITVQMNAIDAEAAVGTDAAYWVTESAITILDIWATAFSAPTGSGAVLDAHLEGATIMTTNKLDFDVGEDDTADAATQPTLTTTSAAAGNRFTFDFDSVGSTLGGKGYQVTIQYRET